MMTAPATAAATPRANGEAAMPRRMSLHSPLKAGTAATRGTAGVLSPGAEGTKPLRRLIWLSAVKYSVGENIGCVQVKSRDPTTTRGGPRLL